MDLSEQTRRRIAEHCRKISVAHNLDPEIQRELAGHMEDKVLGYLGGQEPLTEDDAFIITRERFGDPARIKEMLGATHAGEAAVSLGRHLMAIVLLGNIFDIVSAFISLLLTLIVRRYFPSAFPEHFLQLYWNPLLQISGFAVILLVKFQILKHWKRMLAAGMSPWFVRWSFSAMVVLILLFIALAPMLKDLANGLAFSPAQAYVIKGFPWYFGLPMMLALVIANSILWLWWCDSTPRRQGLMSQTIAWFSLFILIESYAHRFIRQIPDDTAANLHSFILFKTNGWLFIWSPPGFADIPQYGIMFLATIAMGFLGWYTYDWVLKKWARHPDSGDDPLVS